MGIAATDSQSLPNEKDQVPNLDPLKSKKVQGRRTNWSQIVPVLTLILVIIAFSFASEAFLTQRNLTNLSRQVSVNCILAFGMTMIILLGAIDLSIGSLLALGSVTAGLLQVNMHLNQWGVSGAVLTLLAVAAVCGTVGAFNGGLVSRFKMPSFVVTLGMFVIARGLALILSGGSKISPLSDDYRWVGTSFVSKNVSSILIVLATIGLGAYFALTQKSPKRWWQLGTTLAVGGVCYWIFSGYHGIPLPVLLMACVFGIVYFALNRTTFGRSLYAIGGNPEAARLCGLRVPFFFFAAFVIMGILVGLAALIEGGRIDAGDPTAGNLYELDAIAAVVIGGTSLNGGVGTVGGTLLGSFLMGTLNNGMSLMNIQTNLQMVIKGLIIISAVLMDVLSKKTSK